MNTLREAAPLLGMILLLAACGACAHTPPHSPAPNLAGTSWRLVEFQGSDDTTLTPDDPAKYTIAFNVDGGLTARPFVRSYMIKDGHLFLSLMADGGIYEFEPIAKGAAGR